MKRRGLASSAGSRTTKRNFIKRSARSMSAVAARFDTAAAVRKSQSGSSGPVVGRASTEDARRRGSTHQHASSSAPTSRRLTNLRTSSHVASSTGPRRWPSAHNRAQVVRRSLALGARDATLCDLRWSALPRTRIDGSCRSRLRRPESPSHWGCRMRCEGASAPQRCAGSPVPVLRRRCQSDRTSPTGLLKKSPVPRRLGEALRHLSPGSSLTRNERDFRVAERALGILVLSPTQFLQLLESTWPA